MDFFPFYTYNLETEMFRRFPKLIYALFILSFNFSLTFTE